MARAVVFGLKDIKLILFAMELAERRALDDLEATPHLEELTDAEKVESAKIITGTIAAWRELVVRIREGGVEIDEPETGAVRGWRAGGMTIDSTEPGDNDDDDTIN